MKHNRHSQNHENHNPITAPAPTSAACLKQREADFAPSADEVARMAYFSYVNEGSRPGRDVQHWLEAESHLLATRSLTRTHGFHNQT